MVRRREAAGPTAAGIAIRPSWDSPIVDPGEARRDAKRIWLARPEPPPGVDLGPDRQRALLAAMAELAADFDYPATAGERRRSFDFYRRNGRFEGLDARVWFCLARRLAPKTVVEVGAGVSTLLTADLNRRFLGGRTAVLSIDPQPDPVLVAGVPGLSKVLPARVQDVPLALFEALAEDDVLFIDSSHVAKTGSDVVFLCLEVLPRLAPGVVVHFHDIFLPGDYPRDWVLDQCRSWNEQYLVHALLVDSAGFEVVFSSYYAALALAGEVRRAFGGDFAGGSLWLRRRRAPDPPRRRPAR